MNVAKISVTGEKAGSMKQVIYMIGMMGAGKTTVGRTLAQRIGWDFIDMDRETEREQGKRISEIFSSEGEPAFRAMETDLLKRLAGCRRTVIATGGGAALSPENQRILSHFFIQAVVGSCIWCRIIDFLKVFHRHISTAEVIQKLLCPFVIFSLFHHDPGVDPDIRTFFRQHVFQVIFILVRQISLA